MQKWILIRGDFMKNKKISVLIEIIIILILILSSIIILSVIKPSNTEKAKKQENKFSTYLNNFKSSNYQASLVFYTESEELEGVKHSLVTYNYRNSIEEYYIENDKEKRTYQYNDYKKIKKYKNTTENYYQLMSLENQSNQELLMQLLKKAKIKSQSEDTFTLEASKKNIKKFLEEFQKIDEKALKYSESVEYEIIVVTKNNNISNIIIKEKENSDKNIIYTFDKIGEIPEIKITVNEAIKEQ